MDLANQLRNIYALLEKVTVSGGENIECLYGVFFGLSQTIKAIESQQQEKQQEESIKDEKKGVPTKH